MVMTISLNMMDTRTFGAKPRPVMVTLFPAWGIGGLAEIVGITSMVAGVIGLVTFDDVAEITCSPAVILGTEKSIMKVPFLLVIPLVLMALPSSVIGATLSDGKPVPLIVTLPPGDVESGRTLRWETTVNEKIVGSSRPRRINPT